MFKLVVSDPKTRKTYQKEVSQKESGLTGRKIGDSVKGDFVGLSGYELQITGGSDKQGFPMRANVQGAARKRMLLTGGAGFHPKSKGERRRKSIRGNTISEQVVQVNTKVVKYGSKKLDDIFGKKEKAKTEEKAPKEEVKKEAPKAEEKKEAPKEESKKEEVKQEAPKAEEKKEEAKPEEKKEESKKEEKAEEKKPEERKG